MKLVSQVQEFSFCPKLLRRHYYLPCSKCLILSSAAVVHYLFLILLRFLVSRGSCICRWNAVGTQPEHGISSSSISHSWKCRSDDKRGSARYSSSSYPHGHCGRRTQSASLENTPHLSPWFLVDIRSWSPH